MMHKSPFKFLDSYTKDDREIFFGRLEYLSELPGYDLNDIAPLQGLSVCCYVRWTMSNAVVSRAYSAKIRETYRPERATYLNTGQRPVYQRNTIASPVRA
jgi:hypothetical protein